MRFTLIIFGCFVSSYVFAANSIYKCVDAAGKKNYQSTPCRPGFSNTTLNIATGSSTNLDEEKKQQELKQQTEQAKLEEQKMTEQQRAERQANINKEAIAESENNQILIRSEPQKYSAFAIPPYIPDKLSDVVKPFQDRLASIERFRRSAAQKALASSQCERVEASELDVKSTKEMLHFLVNCSTGKTFNFNEQDLQK